MTSDYIVKRQCNQMVGCLIKIYYLFWVYLSFPCFVLHRKKSNFTLCNYISFYLQVSDRGLKGLVVWFLLLRFKEYVYKSMFVCLFVCLYRRNSQTARLIRYSYTGKPLMGPGKVYNYFGVRYHIPPKRNHPWKK